MLQILPQVNILKEYQLKDEVLSSCTNSFKRSMELSCMHILEQKILENQDLLLNNLASYWLFYRAQLIQDTEINDLVWEDWLENIPRKRDFHYINPETTPILGLVVIRTLLKANLSVPISIPQLISPYQLDTIPEVDILTPHCKSEIASLSLFSLLFLSTLLLICFQIL